MQIFELEVFKVFMLVMVRITGLLLTAPVLSSNNFPMMGKAGFAAMTAMLITPLLPEQAPIPNEMVTIAFMGMNELLIGLAIGFVMTIVFAAIQVAGQIIDMLSGFGMANVYNPAMETQVPVFGFFFYLLAALFLLAIDGHHVMIWSLTDTFETIPLGAFAMRPELLQEVPRWGQAMFVDGLLIAAPMAGALLLAYLTMGLMSRVVPQIHLFSVGYPVTVALALIMAVCVIEIYIYAVDGMFSSMFENVATLVNGMT